MKVNLARLFSFVFHPVVFALLAPLLFVYKQTENFRYGLKWEFFSSFFLFLALAGFYLVRPKEFFIDIDISKKEQRHIFYSISLLLSVIYFIVALVFKGILFPLSIVGLGIILGIVVFDLITYYMKISIHAAVASAYVVSIALLFGVIPFFLSLWIIFFVGWSRMKLKNHTEREVVAGILLGASITIATYLIGRLIPQ